MDACKAFRERLLKRVMADASFEEGEATPEFLADQPEVRKSAEGHRAAHALHADGRRLLVQVHRRAGQTRAVPEVGRGAGTWRA
jgi:protein involved in temperature-dependent protein secretion